MKMLLILAVLLALCAPAFASVASDAGTACLDFARDTFLAPDTVGTSLGDPWTIDFSRKTDVTSVLPGLRAVDFYAGLSIASNGPAIRGQSGIGLTNIKGNRLSLIVVTAPYNDATWRVSWGNLPRLGLEPRVSLSRAF